MPAHPDGHRSRRDWAERVPRASLVGHRWPRYATFNIPEVATCCLIHGQSRSQFLGHGTLGHQRRSGQQHRGGGCPLQVGGRSSRVRSGGRIEWRYDRRRRALAPPRRLRLGMIRMVSLQGAHEHGGTTMMTRGAMLNERRRLLPGPATPPAPLASDARPGSRLSLVTLNTVKDSAPFTRSDSAPPLVPFSYLRAGAPRPDRSFRSTCASRSSEQKSDRAVRGRSAKSNDLSVNPQNRDGDGPPAGRRSREAARPPTTRSGARPRA
jgi:hypothetical protein